MSVRNSKCCQSKQILRADKVSAPEKCPRDCPRSIFKFGVTLSIFRDIRLPDKVSGQSQTHWRRTHHPSLEGCVRPVSCPG
jgi:hypothetical protein